MRLIIAAARPVLLRCAGGFQRASGACAGTVLPLLILQGWLTQAVQSTCSYFMLFLDIKKAYDHVLREKILGVSGTVTIQRLRDVYVEA
eukprot:1610655-Prorocentrum_lima.AAC.1